MPETTDHLAHHAGEQALAPLLLLAGSGLPLIAAVARAQLAAVRAPLTRKRGSTPRLTGGRQRP